MDRENIISISTPSATAKAVRYDKKHPEISMGKIAKVAALAFLSAAAVPQNVRANRVTIKTINQIFISGGGNHREITIAGNEVDFAGIQRSQDVNTLLVRGWFPGEGAVTNTVFSRKDRFPSHFPFSAASCRDESDCYFVAQHSNPGAPTVLFQAFHRDHTDRYRWVGFHTSLSVNPLQQGAPLQSAGGPFGVTVGWHQFVGGIFQKLELATLRDRVVRERATLDYSPADPQQRPVMRLCNDTLVVGAAELLPNNGTAIRVWSRPQGGNFTMQELSDSTAVVRDGLAIGCHRTEPRCAGFWKELRSSWMLVYRLFSPLGGMLSPIRDFSAAHVEENTALYAESTDFLHFLFTKNANSTATEIDEFAFDGSTAELVQSLTQVPGESLPPGVGVDTATSGNWVQIVWDAEGFAGRAFLDNSTEFSQTSASTTAPPRTSPSGPTAPSAVPAAGTTEPRAVGIPAGTPSSLAGRVTEIPAQQTPAPTPEPQTPSAAIAGAVAAAVCAALTALGLGAVVVALRRRNRNADSNSDHDVSGSRSTEMDQAAADAAAPPASRPSSNTYAAVPSQQTGSNYEQIHQPMAGSTTTRTSNYASVQPGHPDSAAADGGYESATAVLGDKATGAYAESPTVTDNDRNGAPPTYEQLPSDGQGPRKSQYGPAPGTSAPAYDAVDSALNGGDTAAVATNHDQLDAAPASDIA